MSKERLSLSVSRETRKKYMDVYAKYKHVTHEDIMCFLLDNMTNSSKFAKGIQKAESTLKEWLVFGRPLKLAAPPKGENPKLKITIKDIRAKCRLDGNYAKKLYEAYKEEIEEFNANI